MRRQTNETNKKIIRPVSPSTDVDESRGSPGKKSRDFSTASNIAGVISAVIAFLALLWGFYIYSPSSPSITVIDRSNRDNKIILNQSDSAKRAAAYSAKVKVNPAQLLKPLAISIRASPIKMVFAQVRVIEANKGYNGIVTQKVHDILVSKGYQLAHAGADMPAGSYQNLVAGELQLSEPTKTTGSFDIAVVTYTVKLTLHFLDETGKKNCGQTDYEAKVSTNERDTPERVMEQGVHDLLEKLQNETNFPFCDQTKL